MAKISSNRSHRAPKTDSGQPHPKPIVGHGIPRRRLHTTLTGQVGISPPINLPLPTADTTKSIMATTGSGQSPAPDRAAVPATAVASARSLSHPAQHFGDLSGVRPQELGLLLQILGQRSGPWLARTDLAESKARGTGTIGRAMIEHLRGRERALEPLGWTGREAEWIAVVCLHSGVFIRAQFCHYFDAPRITASRFVKALVQRRSAVESEWPLVNGGGRTCRISGKAIYRVLGVENIRHRRKANRNGVMRRLLSLDFVLEHPGMNWLPTEAEKVEFLEEIGVPSRLIPRRIYYGAVGAQKRYFALKLPVAGDARTVTFAYVDPGRDTTGELNTWGGAHGRLWDAIRAKGRRVEVIAIGAELDTVLRADRVLQLWAAAEPGKVIEGLTVKQEMRAIKEAIAKRNREFLGKYGGLIQAGERYKELLKLPEAELAEGVSIDGYSTYRATRFSDLT